MTVSTPTGRVLRDDEGVRLEFVRTFEAPVTEVWSALTAPERTARWIGTWSGDPASGSIDLLMAEAPEPQPVAVRECSAPTRLALVAPSPDGPWPLSVVLERRDGGTRLVFTHRLAEPYDASSIGPGWHYYLDRLGAVVADAPVPDDWDDYVPALQPAYALPDGP